MIYPNILMISGDTQTGQLVISILAQNLANWLENLISIYTEMGGLSEYLDLTDDKKKSWSMSGKYLQLPNSFGEKFPSFFSLPVN